MVLEVEFLTTGTPDCIYLAAETLDRLGFAKDQEITLMAGANEKKCIIKEFDVQPASNKIYLPSDLAEKLSLPNCCNLKARIEALDRRIKIGPFLGFLTIKARGLKKPPYSTQRPLLEIFSVVALKKGVIPLVFNPQDVDWANSRVHAWSFKGNANGGFIWVQDIFPLPNVVYNRILNRSTERKESVAEAVRNLNKISNLHYFNAKFLNKWETHDILSRNPDLHKFLPETYLVKNLSDIAQLAGKYPSVYIKPINGSLGTNIVKLAATTKGYSYQYRRNNRNYSGLWQDPETMWTELSCILGKRKYVVQQGLDFATYKGRVFDIRLLLQKDLTGTWTTSAIVGRVAAENNIFPNIAAGGVAKRIEEIWTEIFAENWEQSRALSNVLNLASHVPKTLEEALGNFAELGLDIGVDTDGNAWLIEVNSKPSRKVFPKERPDLKLRSMRNIVDYAIFLSGFDIPVSKHLDVTGGANEPQISDC